MVPSIAESKISARFRPRPVHKLTTITTSPILCMRYSAVVNSKGTSAGMETCKKNIVAYTPGMYVLRVALGSTKHFIILPNRRIMQGSMLHTYCLARCFFNYFLYYKVFANITYYILPILIFAAKCQYLIIKT